MSEKRKKELLGKKPMVMMNTQPPSTEINP
jgi:hypothetical protein